MRCITEQLVGHPPLSDLLLLVRARTVTTTTITTTTPTTTGHRLLASLVRTPLGDIRGMPGILGECDYPGH